MKVGKVETEILPDEVYEYRAFSIEHLDELRDDIQKLKESGNLSDNETFRSYIDDKIYELPESLPDASSLIVMAIFTPIALATFEYNGTDHEVIIPHQYYSAGLTFEQIKVTIHEKIIKEDGYNLEMAHQDVFLKQVAVRSGLGLYGRNNICYVGEKGSLITLHAFWTDYEFSTDDWHPLEMMKKCVNCKICMNRCPTGAIREDNFVIDAGRCISLYNEVPGGFPEWLSDESHNALMGCMRCQEKCPANQEHISDVVKLETVTEHETRAILEGEFSDTLSESLSKKLRNFAGTTSEEYFPVLSRNLRVLLKA